MAFTKNFVFTDPVAAQQAVQYAQLASQEQAAMDQAFNDRIRTGTQGRISQQNAQQQQMMNQYQMQQQMMNQYQMQQQAAEREKDRISNQTIAGIQAGPRDEAIKARQAADIEARKAFDRDNWSRGDSFAKTLNTNSPGVPESTKRRLRESGDVVMGEGGLWKSRYPNPDPIVVEEIDNIRRSLQPAPVPGTVVQPGKIFGSNPVPGAVVGSRIPAAMDTIPSRSRMLQMGPPRFSEIPSAPVETSPFEMQGAGRVFRQSDFAPVYPEPPIDQPWMQPGY